MKKRLLFDSGGHGQQGSHPLDTAKHARPLRITLHHETLDHLCHPQKAALTVLLELITLDHFEVYSSAQHHVFPTIVIGPVVEPHDVREVKVQEGSRGGFIRYWSDWQDTIIRSFSPISSSDAHTAAEHLAVALAHDSLEGDILVSMSPYLSQLSATSWGKRWNCLTPQEALEFVGLYLRNLDIYLYENSKRLRRSFTEGTFYWVLAKSLLPSGWRYGYCIHSWSASSEQEEARALFGSISERVAFSLHALDQLALEYFNPRSLFDMIYHLQLAVVMLSGAFEAQANVCRLTYAMKVNRRQTSFRNPTFRQELMQLDSVLGRYVSSPAFTSLLSLIWAPRDLVQHRESLTPMYVGGQNMNDKTTHISVSPPDKRLMQAATTLGGTLSDWGMAVFSHPPVIDVLAIEPYTFFKRLLSFTVDALDQVLLLTRVDSRSSIPGPVPLAPPDSWDEITRNRILLLGGFSPESSSV